jgi:1,4-dihydroxy-2-naphthoate octaprenyltransferase
LLAGFFYTAGPVALAYMGLGEITVGIFMGPVIVIGAYYVQTETVTLDPLLAALPVACLVAAILHANNLRDLEGDRAIGKYTLATIVGRRYANYEYYGLLLGSYATLILTVLAGRAPVYTLIALVTFPSALALIYRVAANTEPVALNPVLQRTAQLHMRFGLLLATGWFFGIIQSAYQIALNQ